VDSKGLKPPENKGSKKPKFSILITPPIAIATSEDWVQQCLFSQFRGRRSDMKSLRHQIRALVKRIKTRRALGVLSIILTLKNAPGEFSSALSVAIRRAVSGNLSRACLVGTCCHFHVAHPPSEERAMKSNTGRFITIIAIC